MNENVVVIKSEMWRPITGYESLYEVSTFGRVRKKEGEAVAISNSQRNSKIVQLHKDKKNKTFSVHRLVAKAFLPLVPGKNEVCHQDGNWENNHVTNLKWGTRLDNELDKIRHGTVNRGERNGGEKLSEKEVLEIHTLSLNGVSNKELAIKYTIAEKHISAILNFRVWRHLKTVLRKESYSILSPVPKLIHGDNFIDDRGVVTFCNHFDFIGVKRFYQITHDKPKTIRAYHGHRLEGKYFQVISGTCLIGVIPLTHGDKIELDTLKGQKFFLSDRKPQILWIPPGYANGIMNLTENMDIMIYSTSTLQESQGDDIRFDYLKWDIWKEEPR
jgi:dTDP-4-dehydrorhamnose 3,5-epimerase-like enzyme